MSDLFYNPTRKVTRKDESPESRVQKAESAQKTAVEAARKGDWGLAYSAYSDAARHYEVAARMAAADPDERKEWLRLAAQLTRHQEKAADKMPKNPKLW